MTKHHSLGDSHIKKTYIAHTSGGSEGQPTHLLVCKWPSIFLYSLMWPRGKRTGSLVSSYKGNDLIMRSPFWWPHLNLTASQSPYLLIPPSWESGLSHRNLGVHKTFGPLQGPRQTDEISEKKTGFEFCSVSLQYQWVDPGVPLES